MENRRQKGAAVPEACTFFTPQYDSTSPASWPLRLAGHRLLWKLRCLGGGVVSPLTLCSCRSFSLLSLDTFPSI